MEILAINKEYVEKYIEAKARNEKADKQAFLFFTEERKKESNLKVVDRVAKINVTGILGNSWYYDTNYNTIIEKTIEAESRDDIDEIEYIIDSPGGSVNGLEEAARAISKTTKKTKATVKNLAASAAYWLASQCDEIVAIGETAQVGSIGVQAVFYDWSKWEEMNGIKEIKIVSSKAPDKNPDPATTKGLKKYQAEVDKLHDIFVKNVAIGRKTDIMNVNENFGQGAVLFSGEAKETGMIDSISLEIEGLNENNTTEKNMAKEDKNEKLFTQAEVDEMIKTAKAEGVEEGETAEKSRVEKHLAYEGAKLETVKEGILSGKEFSECVEKYAEEKFAAKEIESRKKENEIPEKEAGGRGKDGGEKETPEAAHKRLFGE